MFMYLFISVYSPCIYVLCSGVSDWLVAGGRTPTMTVFDWFPSAAASPASTVTPYGNLAVVKVTFMLSRHFVENCTFLVIPYRTNPC